MIHAKKMHVLAPLHGNDHCMDHVNGDDQGHVAIHMYTVVHGMFKLK